MRNPRGGSLFEIRASLSRETILAKVGAAAEVPPMRNASPPMKILKRSAWAATSGIACRRKAIQNLECHARKICSSGQCGSGQMSSGLHGIYPIAWETGSAFAVWTLAAGIHRASVQSHFLSRTVYTPLFQVCIHSSVYPGINPSFLMLHDHRYTAA